MDGYPSNGNCWDRSSLPFFVCFGPSFHLLSLLDLAKEWSKPRIFGGHLHWSASSPHGTATGIYLCEVLLTPCHCGPFSEKAATPDLGRKGRRPLKVFQAWVLHPNLYQTPAPINTFINRVAFGVLSRHCFSDITFLAGTLCWVRAGRSSPGFLACLTPSNIVIAQKLHLEFRTILSG